MVPDISVTVGSNGWTKGSVESTAPSKAVLKPTGSPVSKRAGPVRGPLLRARRPAEACTLAWAGEERERVGASVFAAFMASGFAES